MWTEKVTWFSNEEGRKGRIEEGQLADLIVPDRDFFACAESEIADASSQLTMVGGKIVYAADVFASLDEGEPPPAMPDWSPVRTYGGFAAWHTAKADAPAPGMTRAMACVCARACGVHGHRHSVAWSSRTPGSDDNAFWGVLGCSCWAV
jgi:hypothetical protein